jgi:hypothetical protein
LSKQSLLGDRASKEELALVLLTPKKINLGLTKNISPELTFSQKGKSSLNTGHDFYKGQNS